MTTANYKPTVLIVGAGLGGLMLGALLEKIDIPYIIFERTSLIRPLGSAISIGSPILALFQQLGIDDELVNSSLRYNYIAAHKENMEPYPLQDFTPLQELTGYPQYIIARPVLYDLLLRQIPAHKILLKKRILTISEEDDRVTIYAFDNTAYQGDLLVGADGAYSVVRQRLYEKLKKRGLLPKSDDEELPFNCTCLVGQTDYMDPDEFPILKNPCSQVLAVRGTDLPYSWLVFTTAQSTCCWMVIRHLSKFTNKTALEEKFARINMNKEKNSEWGSHAAKQMCDETRDLRTPIRSDENGYLTLGDLYDRTPQDRVSKVMLEEKVFETWYYGRTVLLGDACHKVNPLGGQGATAAIHDALALANLLYALPRKTSTDIKHLLSCYQDERRPKAHATFKNSRLLSHVLRKDNVGKMARMVSTNMPTWMWRIFLAKAFGNRPQAGFLERVEVKGTAHVFSSPSMDKARAVFDEWKERMRVIHHSV
ncbi:hypothetical protein BG015_005872 [Linnemannia schmuckeri]|uniref:FAD-binding domain-containing protein n=1 Tax=Linnemannia schmuckeri TaxID=64567 RepID=A0A9P5VBV7_9FUNG|nr:hypothetical protein BG015_005872 [Linnemannia schmuckeri]